MVTRRVVTTYVNSPRWVSWIEGAATSPCPDPGDEHPPRLQQESGRLFVPAGIEGLEPADATLEGTWEIEGSEMILNPEAETFLDGLRFRARGGGLTSEETLGEARLRGRSLVSQTAGSLEPWAPSRRSEENEPSHSSHPGDCMLRLTTYLACLVLALATVGCGDDPTGLGAFGVNPGIHVAAKGEPDDIGRFELVTPGAPARDLIAESAAIEVDLRRGGELHGRLFIPAGIDGLEPTDVTLEGTWELVEGSMVLSPQVDTILDDLRFRSQNGRLVSEEPLGDARLVIELQFEHLAHSDPSLDEETWAFELLTHNEFDSRFGRRGVLLMKSRRDNPVALVVGSCFPLLRAYHAGELVWDQRDDTSCTGSFGVHRVETGQVIELRTPWTNACQITPPGREARPFRLTVYMPFGDEEIEVHVQDIIMFCA